MKRQRLWWCAGVLVLVVAAGFWWSGPSASAPRVSLTFLGYTNRMVVSGQGGGWSLPMGLIGVTNRGTVPVELRMSSVPLGSSRDGGFKWQPQVWVDGLVCRSVTNSPGQPLVLGVSMPMSSTPWVVELQYEELTAAVRWRGRLSQFPNGRLRSWALGLLPPPMVHRVRLGPTTTLPPVELFRKVDPALLESLSYGPVLVPRLRSVPEVNVPFLRSNKPPAERR